MASITLASILRSAWSLHLAGALPHPAGMSIDRMVSAGGFRPWLQLALTGEDAAELAASGKSAWHLGALLGLDPAHDGVLSAPLAETSLIRLVEGLCEEAGSPVWSLLSAERSRVAAYGDAWAESFLAAFQMVDRNAPAYPVVLDVLRAIADSFGIDLSRVEPADLNSWRTENLTATVSGVRKAAAMGGRIGHEFLDVEAVTEDGLKLLIPMVHENHAGVGQRVRVTMHGVTEVHPGYPAMCRSLNEIRQRESVRRLIDLDLVSAMTHGCLTSDGRALEVGDTVVLNCDCLEAPRGTYGRVVDVAGDMADVEFDGVADPVPCYGHALDFAGATGRVAA